MFLVRADPSTARRKRLVPAGAAAANAADNAQYVELPPDSLSEEKQSAAEQGNTTIPEYFGLGVPKKKRQKATVVVYSDSEESEYVTEDEPAAVSPKSKTTINIYIIKIISDL